ncbi:MAG: PilZ domain-containing protein [Planctomycetota bacterium]|nr:PilZ domain-containing protein [Planctomycetota bacterium]
MTRPHRERRACKRFDLTCPIVVTDSEGNELLKTKTLNISDGGALLTAPIGQTIPLRQRVRVDMRLPRSTENTFMYEDISTEAGILRHQPMKDYDNLATALTFTNPLKLQLEA